MWGIVSQCGALICGTDSGETKNYRIYIVCTAAALHTYMVPGTGMQQAVHTCTYRVMYWDIQIPWCVWVCAQLFSRHVKCDSTLVSRNEIVYIWGMYYYVPSPWSKAAHCTSRCRHRTVCPLHELKTTIIIANFGVDAAWFGKPGLSCWQVFRRGRTKAGPRLTKAGVVKAKVGHQCCLELVLWTARVHTTSSGACSVQLTTRGTGRGV